MRRLALPLAIALAAMLCAAPAARAEFGLRSFDVGFAAADGSPATQAGSHPDTMTTEFEFNGTEAAKGGTVLDEPVKDLIVSQIAGFVGKPTAVPRCTTVDFLTRVDIVLPGGGGLKAPGCPDNSAVGTVSVTLSSETLAVPLHGAVYNLEPAPGVAARLGFWIGGVPVPVELGVDDSPPNKIVGGPTNVSQVLEVVASRFLLWGVPAAPAHDALRGHCLSPEDGSSLGECLSNLVEEPFLTLPRACEGALTTSYAADSWFAPGALLPGGRPDLSDPSWITGSVLTHDDADPPGPQGMTGCAKLDFDPSIAARPTTRSAAGPSGLEFSLDLADEGLTNATGIAGADVEKAVVTLPEGMTANPALAEGLDVCGEAELARESASSPPGAGCPEAAKIGTVEVETPLLEQTLGGAVYVAEPYDNPFGTLLALYLVIKSPQLGIVIRQPLKVEPDPRTGQLVTTAEEIPQLPFSHLRLRLREGARSPLVSPPRCGEASTVAVLTPSSGKAPARVSSSFEISSGPAGGPCPGGGAPPFDPGFEAGTVNNAAGRFSPFQMRLTRRDGEAYMTRFSAKLPPGLVARLAGTARCPDAAIAAARTKTGLAERSEPSCPASSRIGRVRGSAGVGAQLTSVPGELYLAGPLGGAPLSAVAIVPAVAGPFDVGNVVVRQALRIDPRSAAVTADGAASDPLPHILAGIPLNVRDVRVYVDRSSFTLNPTSCERFAVGATIWGGGSDPFSPADDSPLARAVPFQAASCAALGFAPRLALRLKGGTKRGDHPALTGTYRPRPGDANLERLVLRLPRSAFLDQGHIRTICTRVQFAAESCPKGAIYGHATAATPLLEEPLSGPVYLRSSSHDLPDFVADLHGAIDVEAVARIDSVRGGIRATFSGVPDAPLSKVVVRMRGGKRGLIVNSTGLCAGKRRANARFVAQNGEGARGRPALRSRCKSK